MEDDRLRLIFTCCHPALSAEAQIALTLRLLGGLTTAEVARAFLVAEPTMAKRLVRAKHKIKFAHIPFRIPSEAELPERLRPVLAVLYLTYNAGTDGPSGDDLRREAIRLARAIAGLMPDEAEVAGLVALLLLTESRWPARYSDAASFAATDWNQILALYDQLLSMTPTPVVAMNRAIALGEIHGPQAALDVLDGLDLGEYHLFHAARADLLRRLGRHAEASRAYARAATSAVSEAELIFLNGRLETARAER